MDSTFTMGPSWYWSYYTIVTAATGLLALAHATPSGRPCRFLPGDVEWPTASDWSHLNESVGGRLIIGLPLAHVCHGADYDAAACASLREDWTDSPR